jgi:hypothetical protein
MSGLEREMERRKRALASAISRMADPRGLGLVVTLEDAYLLSGAQLCFTRGADAGAVFCAHASCERDLASLLKFEGNGPPGSERWGLGPLITHCVQHHDLPQSLAVHLRALNESRKTLYHFGHSEAEASLARATEAIIEEVGSERLRQDFMDRFGYEGRNKEVWKYAVDRALEGMGLAALEAAMQLRSWLARDLPQ